MTLKAIKKGKYDFFFLTLTGKNSKELTRESLNRLKKQFARLRGLEAGKEEGRGGVYSLETKNNPEAQEWHPPLHVLLECRRALPSRWLGNLKRSWRRITSGSHVIRLERMYGTSRTDKRGHGKRRINRSALRELIKYATKSASFGHVPELVDTFLTAFENVRRIQSFGSFLGIQKEADAEVEKISDPTAVKCALLGSKCRICPCFFGLRLPKLLHFLHTVFPFDLTPP